MDKKAMDDEDDEMGVVLEGKMMEHCQVNDS